MPPPLLPLALPLAAEKKSVFSRISTDRAPRPRLLAIDNFSSSVFGSFLLFLSDFLDKQHFYFFSGETVITVMTHDQYNEPRSIQ